MTLKPTDITTLVELFASSDWDELHVEIDGLQLFLSTDANARLTHAGSVAAAPTVIERVDQVPRVSVDGPANVRPAAATKSVATEPSPAEVPSNWVAITAPNLGTFYRAPKPGTAPYVEEGQAVDAETEVCLLEVMKLFTTVKAGTAGFVRRICVNDAEMVEFGQTLLYIERT